MCKEVVYHCDKQGCDYSETKEKKELGINLTPYPQGFKRIKINGSTYHLCQPCYEELKQLNDDFINGDAE